MSVLSHCVLAFPVMARMGNKSSPAGNIAKYSGVILAFQELMMLIFIYTQQQWYIQRRLPLALCARLFRLAVHTIVWVEFPRGALVLKLAAEGSPIIDPAVASQAATHSLLMTPLQSFMHTTSFCLPFKWQLAMALAKAAVDVALTMPAIAGGILNHAPVLHEMTRMCRHTDSLLQLMVASPGAEHHHVTCRYGI
jgi:hypothetical protein